MSDDARPPCPKCGAPHMIEGVRRDGAATWICVECPHWEPRVEKEESNPPATQEGQPGLAGDASV